MCISIPHAIFARPSKLGINPRTVSVNIISSGCQVALDFSFRLQLSARLLPACLCASRVVGQTFLMEFCACQYRVQRSTEGFVLAKLSFCSLAFDFGRELQFLCVCVPRTVQRCPDFIYTLVIEGPVSGPLSEGLCR